MGTVSSKDTRRISFDNSISLSSALATKTIRPLEVDNGLDLDVLSTTAEKGKDLLFKDSNRSLVSEDNGDEMEYWARRLDKLKKEHREINEVIQTEYQKTYQISNKLIEKPPLTDEKIMKIRPCYEFRAKVMKCYEENPSQPLLCSRIVEDFTRCVSACQEE